MYVQVNTGNGLENKDSLDRWAFDYLNNHLSRFRQDISAVEVQLTDENHGARNGNSERRCLMEARLNGHAPIAVKHYAPNQDLAFRGAAEKLLAAVSRTLGKLERHEHRARDSIRRDVEVHIEEATQADNLPQDELAPEQQQPPSQLRT